MYFECKSSEETEKVKNDWNKIGCVDVSVSSVSIFKMKSILIIILLEQTQNKHLDIPKINIKKRETHYWDVIANSEHLVLGCVFFSVAVDFFLSLFD